MDQAAARAWRSAHGVCLQMTRNVADCLRAALADFERALTGRRKGLLGRRPRPVPDRRLFPDTYTDREESAAFRARHGAAQREQLLDAVRRTLLAFEQAAPAALAGQPAPGGEHGPSGRRGEAVAESWVVTLDAASVPEVFIALGHAQVSHLARPRWNERIDWPTVTLRRGGTALMWLMRCQTALANAALTDEGDETVFTA